MSAENITMVSNPSCADLANCKLCPRLVRGRKDPVCWQQPTRDIGVRIMFIGEGPWKNEDAEGKPFVGPSRKRFDALLEALEIEREGVYITNAIKCFAPDWERRSVEAWGEIQNCRRSWLIPEITAFDPQVIFALGMTALKSVRDDKTLNEDIDPSHWPQKLKAPGDCLVASLCYFPHPSPTNCRHSKRYNDLANDPLIIGYRGLLDSLRRSK